MTKRQSTYTHYLGQPLGNSQDPDEPYDHTADRVDGVKISGIGAQGGGSKPTHQAHRPRSTTMSGSTAPKSAQKLRG